MEHYFDPLYVLIMLDPNLTFLATPDPRDANIIMPSDKPSYYSVIPQIGPSVFIKLNSIHPQEEESPLYTSLAQYHYKKAPSPDTIVQNVKNPQTKEQKIKGLLDVKNRFFLNYWKEKDQGFKLPMSPTAFIKSAPINKFITGSSSRRSNPIAHALAKPLNFYKDPYIEFRDLATKLAVQQKILLSSPTEKNIILDIRKKPIISLNINQEKENHSLLLYRLFKDERVSPVTTKVEKLSLQDLWNELYSWPLMQSGFHRAIWKSQQKK